MGFSYNVNVLNQKGSPALYTDIFANRPAAGYQGRLFVSTDTAAIYEDTGTAWTLIANVSSGAGTLQQVTTNGNTSNVGIVITAGGLSTNSLTDTALTSGSVTFAGTGGLISQDNSNLFWDDTNNRLGINTNTPGNSLDVHTGGTTPALALNNTAGSQSAISFLNTSVSKWRIGNTATNTFDFYNFALGQLALTIDGSNNFFKFLKSIMISQGAGFSPEAGYNGIGGDAGGFFFNLGTNTFSAYLNFIGLTGGRTFTFPDTSGTVALTSNLSSYVPYTGATTTVNLGAQSISAGTGTFGTTGALLFLGTSNTTDKYITIQNSSGNLEIGTNSTTHYVIGNGSLPLQLFTNGTSRVLIGATTGNVLLGSTTDDTVNKLQVTGNIVSKSTGNPFFGSQKNGGATYGFYSDGAGSLILVDFGVAVRGNFNMGTGVYTPTSDINKKKDFELSSLGLNAILGLKPTLYRMKEDKEDSPKYLGFLAQEVKEFIPQSFVEKDDFIGLDYQSITATLVKAVQEQQSIIDGLLKRIELLENK